MVFLVLGNSGNPHASLSHLITGLRASYPEVVSGKSGYTYVGQDLAI